MSNLEVRPTQFLRFGPDEVVETRLTNEQIQDSVIGNNLGVVADLSNYILQASSGMGYKLVVSAPITVYDVEKQLGVSSDLWDTVDPQELVTAIVTLARSI